MNAIKIFFLILFLRCFLCAEKKLKNPRKPATPIELPCEFSFDTKFGYSCKVINFDTLGIQNLNVTNVTGTHLIERGFQFQNHDVHRLSIYNLDVSYIPANITLHLSKLRTLQIKKCGLRQLMRGPDFHGLRRLYLGFNEIKHIPMTYFWSFCSLEMLSLYHNKITDIPELAFRDLIKLKRLSLNGNRIKSIDSMLFQSCLRLEFVDLDNNEIQMIEGDLFANLTSLNKITIQNNEIIFIENEFLSTIWNQSLKQVLLRRNNCIDYTYPDDGDYYQIKQVFDENCAPSIFEKVINDTTAPPPRKKPKYKTPPILYFEHCTWKIHKDYPGLYKSSF